MDRIIVAFETEETRGRICDMLESGGVTPCAVCRSGGEVIRAFKKLEKGIIVCGYKLADMTADALAHTLGDSCIVLVIARPMYLEMCEQEEVFKLATPIKKSDLLASINMLSQISERLRASKPTRKSSSKGEIVERAKEVLMSKNHMTEAQAHRFIQKKSMDSGSRLEDTAQLIVNAY